MRRSIPALAVLCLAAACTPAPPAGAPAPERGVRVESGSTTVVETIDTRRRPGVIHPGDFAQVIPRVRAITVEPARVELRVGERIAWADLRVTALDSAGRGLGRLTFYDRSLFATAARMDADGITGVSPGEGTLAIGVSLFHQYGGQGAVPRARVPVVVLP